MIYTYLYKYIYILNDRTVRTELEYTMTYTPVFYALYPNGRPGAYGRWGEFDYLPEDRFIEFKWYVK